MHIMFNLQNILALERTELMKFYSTYYTSPLGTIHIQATQEAVCSLKFVKYVNSNSPDLPDILRYCLYEIDEYFKGNLKRFSVPITMNGTYFQLAVWKSLQTLPYGKTLSYRDIADYIQKPNAYRAVGHANKKNPLPIIIPCHRVVGKNGHLTGYNKGLWRKKWLIEHEKEYVGQRTNPVKKTD